MKIYKLIPLAGNRVEAIRNKKLWFSSASTFNDPFDCAIEPQMDREINIYDLENNMDELAIQSNIFYRLTSNGYYDCDSDSECNLHVYEEVMKRIKNIGISSFLSTPYNIVTWSHYGQEHKGVCLEYTIESQHLYKRFNGFELRPVQYTNIMPRFNWEEFLSAPNYILNTIFTTKYKDWAYEDEIRIISNDYEGNSLIDLNEIGIKLSRIYFGCEAINDQYSADIQEIAENLGVPCIRLTRKTNTYSLIESVES